MDHSLTKWRTLYHNSLSNKGFQPDSHQLLIIDELARIETEAFEHRQQLSTRTASLLTKLFSRRTTFAPPPKGLYLYGSVGRGKTFLMDLFCEQVSLRTRRVHYHHFMKGIHEELHTITEQRDPLAIVAKNIAASCEILCIDEFMVSDITDAMLLYKLLTFLSNEGIIVVTTSNIAPDNLYKNGLQRQNFLPAIAWIKEHLVVYQIGSGEDFRRRNDEHAEYFFHSDDKEKCLTHIFEKYSGNAPLNAGSINIHGRDIPYKSRSAQIIWFAFSVLCEGNRSQLDYISIAEQFTEVIISDIPVFDQYSEDAAKRFLLLIDELYDRRIKLFLSSAAPVESLYRGNKLAFEFDRVQSRLFEMQSTTYG